MNEISTELLRWYQENQRTLPWRKQSQKTNADAYRVWLSEIMLQQTTVEAVKPYYNTFMHLWPSLQDLASAPLDDVLSQWAGLGYYARARNLHKCAQTIQSQYDGEFPDSEKELLKLSGIGAYTAAAIITIAFKKRAVVVDTNIERIISRIFAIQTALPQSKPEIYKAMDSVTPDDDCGDFAQAFMDMASAICTVKSPKCDICPIGKNCKSKNNNPERLPIKQKKKEKPVRFCNIYVIQCEEFVACERRPEKGLLGGMLGLPTTTWGDAIPESHDQAPLPANWQKTANRIKHTFTHFHLYIDVYTTQQKQLPDNYRATNGKGLPTIFKKALQESIRETENGKKLNNPYN